MGRRQPSWGGLRGPCPWNGLCPQNMRTPTPKQLQLLGTLSYRQSPELSVWLTVPHSPGLRALYSRFSQHACCRPELATILQLLTYIRNAVGLTTVNVCVDIDECKLYTTLHDCANTVGNYTCSCRTGYELVNRMMCKGSSLKHFQSQLAAAEFQLHGGP